MLRRSLWVALACGVLACSRSEHTSTAPAREPPVVAPRSSGSTVQGAGPSAPLGAAIASTPSPASSARAEPLVVGQVGQPLVVAPSQAYEPPLLEPGEQRPLLLFLHGFGSGGAVAFQALRFAEFGARMRVFVLAPDGSTDATGRKFWDAGPACCNFGGPPIDDIARVDELLQRYLARGVVDPKRVFVIGYSNGGFLAHRVACQLSPRVAAVASVAGAAPKTLVGCNPSSSIAVLEVHGDKDQVVSYAGGSVFQRPEVPTHSGAKEGLLAWASLLGCTERSPQETKLDLFAALPDAETHSLRHERCARGSAALLTVVGGDHYLGAEPKLLTEIWRYFERYPKP